MTVEQTHVDLLQLVNTPLKRQGRFYSGPCPMCGGKDRFVIKPDEGIWLCRHCSPTYRDAVGFIMARDGVDFRRACEVLNITLQMNQHKQQRQPRPPAPHMADLREDYACFQPDWQVDADQFVTESVLALDTEAGAGARRYLAARGITNPGWYELGFNPVDRRDQWGTETVWLPRGIVIPWEIDGEYWRIRIRRSSADLKPGDAKYAQATGSANGMYGIQFVQLGTVVILVEGEFDKLLLDTLLKGDKRLRRWKFVNVATGGTGNGRLLRWAAQLALADQILLAFDDDANGAGDKAAADWMKVFPRARRLRPLVHDVTDMWKVGINIPRWVVGALQ